MYDELCKLYIYIFAELGQSCYVFERKKKQTRKKNEPAQKRNKKNAQRNCTVASGE